MGIEDKDEGKNTYENLFCSGLRIGEVPALLTSSQ